MHYRFQLLVVYLPCHYGNKSVCIYCCNTAYILDVNSAQSSNIGINTVSWKDNMTSLETPKAAIMRCYI